MKFAIPLLFLIVVLKPIAKGGEYSLPWKEHGKLVVEAGERIIRHDDGVPFLWLGCTSWGMTEWLSRPDVDTYLDDRKSKGFNVVQFCLFWGKRTEDPVRFELNPENAYGHKAFYEKDGILDILVPAIRSGEIPESPNDYWDHVDYCVRAMERRGMYAAIMPFWGRRYLNATHEGQSSPVFSKENIRSYGKFLGQRYKSFSNVIWVLGGDVKADQGRNLTDEYRMLAEGIAEGVTGETLKWDQPDKGWGKVFMTYHPDADPDENSSTWFHNDAWLDTNMIETFIHRDQLVYAIQNDLKRLPQKPTVMGEPQYEAITGKNIAEPIHIRRQAWQSFFSGAAGFTYGGGTDSKGNGPLFSPSNNWKQLLNLKGASQLIHLRSFLESNEWERWRLNSNYFMTGVGEGEREKLAVVCGNRVFIYFPENTPCQLDLKGNCDVTWYCPSTGRSVNVDVNFSCGIQPPEGWEDAVIEIVVIPH